MTQTCLSSKKHKVFIPIDVWNKIDLMGGSRPPLGPKTDQRIVGNLSLVFGIQHQEVFSYHRPTSTQLRFCCCYCCILILKGLSLYKQENTSVVQE